METLAYIVIMVISTALVLAVASAFITFVATILNVIGFVFDAIGLLIYGLYLMIEEWLKKRKNS